MTDISETLAPASDQLDAVDLLGQPPRVFTITQVDVKTSAEQPVSVHLAEFDRVWRPGKSMRRVLAYCWGADSAGWIGRQVELYCDERVKFGNDVVGGTRISRLSHIDGPKSVPLMVSRGKSASFKVQPLPEATPTPAAAPEPTADEVAACTDKAELGAMWKRSGPERRAEIEQRVADLDNEPEA